MPPRVRLLALFLAALLIGDLLHWASWLLRYIVPIFIVLWLGWLFVSHIAGM